MQRPFLLLLVSIFLCTLAAGTVDAAILPRRSVAAIRAAQRRASRVRAQRASALLRTSIRVGAEERVRGAVPLHQSSSESPPSTQRTPFILPPPAPSTARLTQFQADVLSLINKERKNVGLSALTINDLLQQSAQAYASDMHARTFFGHRSPEGESSLDRIRAAGYLDPPCDCDWAYTTGENLAQGQRTPSEVVRSWMESASHRENVLHPSFLQTGIGFDHGYWVQHFGGIAVQ